MRRPSPGVLRRAQPAQQNNLLNRGASNTTNQTDQNDLSTTAHNTVVQSDTQSEIQMEERKEDYVVQYGNFKLQQNYPTFDPVRLNQIYKSEHLGNQILTMRYSNNSNNIAFGSHDDIIRVFNLNKKHEQIQLKGPGACTCLRWCPDSTGINNSLVAVYATGAIHYWHVEQNRLMGRYYEQDNPLNAVDVSPDGQNFATGGQDGKIRLYNLGKRTEPTLLTKSEWGPEHNNRVYGMKFHPTDPNMLLTGGWDNVVLFWDLRMKWAAGFIYGPKVFADSFDIQGHTLLTGSWREEKQLQLFDIRNKKRLEDINWEKYDQDPRHESYVYCCQFSKQDPNEIIAGSSGSNEIRIFKNKGGKHECVDIFRQGIDKGVQCLDGNLGKKEFAYGCADGQFGLINYE